MAWFFQIKPQGFLLLLYCTLILQVIVMTVSAYNPLSDETVRNLPAAGKDFDIHNGGILAPILIPRVPGTPGSAAVRQHFVDWFTTHLPKWTIEFQNSTAKTPVSGNDEIPFVNMIVTRDPPWTRQGDVGRLALVAHYDSKLTPAGFIGAIDSAAPCAMIMHAARSVDEALSMKWARMEEEGISGLEDNMGLQIIFLDGEEAFLNWSREDSVYGAKSLAEEWENTPHPALSTYRTPLSSIELFLLLDLLGHSNPTVPSFSMTTHWAYRHLATIESRLRSLGQMQSSPHQHFLHDSDPNKQVFTTFGIEDDHIPFLERGVEILHMIPQPFPVDVWHQMEDDGEHLDMPTVEDWAKIVTAFVGEWMDLEGFFPGKGEAERLMREKRLMGKRKTELN